jgi:hypothetical protein
VRLQREPDSSEAEILRQARRAVALLLPFAHLKEWTGVPESTSAPTEGGSRPGTPYDPRPDWNQLLKTRDDLVGALREPLGKDRPAYRLRSLAVVRFGNYFAGLSECEERSPLEQKAVLEYRTRLWKIWTDTLRDYGSELWQEQTSAAARLSAPWTGVMAVLKAVEAIRIQDWSPFIAPRLTCALDVQIVPSRAECYDGYLGFAWECAHAAWPGQVILSASAWDEVRDDLPEGATCIPLCEGSLNGSADPTRLYLLVHPSLEPIERQPPRGFAPLDDRYQRTSS